MGTTSADYIYSPETSVHTGPPFLSESNLATNKYSAPEKILENPDVIVIGSGIGGLGIASLMAQLKQKRVLILEASPIPGGCTRCYEFGGFEWNTGIDSIGDMDPTVGRGLFRPTIDFITGGQLQWAKMPDVHEVVSMGGDEYQWHSTPEDNIAWVEKSFPGQGDIRRYYDLEDRIERSAWAWAATKLLPNWIPEVLREVFYKVFGGKWRSYMERSTQSVFVDELGFSEKLASVYSYMYGNHGRTPDVAPFAFHATNLFHYRTGAYYPVGGPGQIPECVIPIVEAAGGQLAVSTPAKRIIVENNTAVGVELGDGRVVRAPLVISDASAYTTLMQLLDREVAEKHGYPEKFTQIRPSVAHLTLFLGYEEAIDLPKEIIWHIPSYDIAKIDARYKAEMSFDDMGAYFLSPSARDPVYPERYPNKSTVIVLAEAPYAWIERCEKDPEFRAKFEADVTSHLIPLVHRYMPQLRDKKPALVEARATMGCNPSAWDACSLGLEPSRDRFIRHTHWLKPQTKVRNLYLTGCDALSMGFAGSMLASRVCYSAITGNWLLMAKKRIG